MKTADSFHFSYWNWFIDLTKATNLFVRHQPAFLGLGVEGMRRLNRGIKSTPRQFIVPGVYNIIL